MLLALPAPLVAGLLAVLPPGARRAHPIVCSGATEPESSALTLLGGSLARVVSADEDAGGGWLREGEAFVKLPPSTPWAVVHFVGGAALGSAPALCYSDLLTSLAERAGVAIVATPYTLGIDHHRLSRAVVDSFDGALDACRSKWGLSSSAPTFRVGHSLGAKLLVLGSLSAPSADDFGKLGLVSFNNLMLSDSAALAAELFASSDAMGGLGGGGDERGESIRRNVASAFAFAQAVGAATGAKSFEVTPTPAELEEAVSEGYAAPDTAVFRFDGDRLDNSDALLEALPESAPRSVTRLAGTHTSPVAFRLSASDIDPALALLLGSDRALTVGDPRTVEPLCDALCGWIWPGALPAARPTLGASADAVEVDADVLE